MFEIDGAVASPRRFDGNEFASAIADAPHVDVSRLDSPRTGSAVPLSAVLDLVQPLPEATHVTLHAADGFAASVPIESVRDRGLIIYALDEAPLPESAGGPLRFFVPDAASCRTAEVDTCANVKALTRIELTAGRGADTRGA
jgi:DMSO/TMAO reductase YedYZ molybdopterin-dependent catalytic subunit